MAVNNMFAGATNRRDRAEMARLRPRLLALLEEEPGDRAGGWINYFLALDAYIEGRFEAATEYASVSVAVAEEIEYAYMHAAAANTLLLAKSAFEEAISQRELSEALALIEQSRLAPLVAFGLWLVARYAAAVAPEQAGAWLAHGERILAASDSEIWPESVLRDETMAELGITDLAPLLGRTPVLDHAAALTQARAWVDGRDADERVPRRGALEFATATS
jgi:hypothetical protein